MCAKGSSTPCFATFCNKLRVNRVSLYFREYDNCVTSDKNGVKRWSYQVIELI